MNGYSFTEDVRHILAQALHQAVELGHDHVRPEHILLGVLFTPCPILTDVFRTLRIDTSELWSKVLADAGPSQEPVRGGQGLPYSSQAKRVLECAMREAYRLQHSYVGAEHILLGIIGAGESVGAAALTASGVTLDATRTEVLRWLNDDRVGKSFDWLAELGALTRQLSDSLVDVKHPRTPEDLLLVVVSDDTGARHILEISGVEIEALKREIIAGAVGVGGPTSLREFVHAAKNEQQFLGDCALASHHLLLAYLALRPAHGYRALSERGVTHASVRSIAEKIFG